MEGKLNSTIYFIGQYNHMVEKGTAQGIVVKELYLKLCLFHFEENIQLF